MTRTMRKVPLHSNLPLFKGEILPFPLGQAGAREVIGNEQSQEIATTEAGGTKRRHVTRGWRGSVWRPQHRETGRIAVASHFLPPPPPPPLFPRGGGKR